MKHLLVIILISQLVGSGAEPVEVFSREDVLKGARKPTTKVSRIDPFNAFRLTHEWTGKDNIKLRIWEAPGMWPGDFPVIAQVWKGEDDLLLATKLLLPAARPVRFWAFSLMHSSIIINVECQHRHHPDENGIYAFRVGWNYAESKWNWHEGGPVIIAPRNPIPDGLAKNKQEGKQASDGDGE